MRTDPWDAPEITGWGHPSGANPTRVYEREVSVLSVLSVPFARTSVTSVLSTETDNRDTCPIHGDNRDTCPLLGDRQP